MSKTNRVSEVLTQILVGGAAMTGRDYSAQIMGGRTLTHHRSLVGPPRLLLEYRLNEVIGSSTSDGDLGYAASTLDKQGCKSQRTALVGRFPRTEEHPAPK